MSDYVLWRRLTETDFHAMRGEASPHGRGGGAMHVALGVRDDRFPIDHFLQAGPQKTITIATEGDLGNYERSTMTFSGNPVRRGGEWIIHDQFSNRHPAWSSKSGFPERYQRADPPYVFIFRVGNRFHVRFSNKRRLEEIGPEVIPRQMLTQRKGIALAPVSLLGVFRVPVPTLLESFQEQEREEASEPFDPSDVLDGRKRVLGAVLQRLGQHAFRRKLLSAYDGQCAITQTRALWVLEAAHITPYRGVRTNFVSNGMLLRADVHTLFDLCLISIDPHRLSIRVSSSLAGSEYAQYDGKKPALPKKQATQPSRAALEEHYRLFQP